MAFPPVIAGAAAARGVSAMSARSSVSSAVAQGSARATQRSSSNLLQGAARAPASARQQPGAASSLRRQRSEPQLPRGGQQTEGGAALQRRHSTGDANATPVDAWPVNAPPARRHSVSGAETPHATQQADNGPALQRRHSTGEANATPVDAWPVNAPPARRHSVSGAETPHAAQQADNGPALRRRHSTGEANATPVDGRPVKPPPARRHSLSGSGETPRPAAPARRHSLSALAEPHSGRTASVTDTAASLADWSNTMLQLVDQISERHAAALSADEKTTLAAKQAQRQRMERPSPESQPPSGAATPLNGLLNNLSLNGERLNINASPALAPLLEQTLGKTDQRYRWHANNGQHQHVLLDHSGRLLNVQDSPLAFTAIAHSKPVAPEQQPRMDRAGQRIALLHNGVREHRPLPDQAVQSMLTGIFSHQRADGAQTEHLRLHEKRLHRFDESSQRWEPTHGVDEKTFDKLSRQGDNQLYAIQGDKRLHNLSSQQKSLMFDDKIAAFSAGSQGEMAVVLKDKETHAQHLRLLNSITTHDWQSPKLAMKQSVNGQQSDFHLGAIALHGGQILAVDPDGKLFSAAPPAAGASEINFSEDPRNQAVQAAFGAGAQIAALHSDGQGRLHATVKDRMDNEHSCQLDANGVTPGWNLSESMVMDYQKGLRRSEPLPHAVVDCGRLGKLALMDGNVHFYDSTSQRWEPTSEKADRLVRGSDGMPMKVEDGEAKPLKINQAGNKTLYHNNLFQLTQVKNSVKADLAVHGLGKESKTQTIAPLGNGRLLSLNESGEVKLHQTSPGQRRDRLPTQTLTSVGLPATQGLTGDAAKQAQLKDIVVNEHNKLFGLTGGGQLFMLDSKQWQSNGGNGWQPVSAPPNLGTLASLHTDEKGRLMAADSNGNAARLEAGAWQPVNRQQALSAHQNNSSAETFGRLGDASKTGRIPGTHVSWKREIDLFGSTGNDTTKVNNPFRKRMEAFVLRTSGGLCPRPLKNLNHEVKQRFKGHEGLSPLYQAQNQIAHDITAQHTHTTQRKPPLEQRLQKLNIHTRDPALHEEINAFAEDLGHSLMLRSRAVGQHYGVLNENNQINTDAARLKHTHGGHLSSSRQRDTRMVGTLHQMIANHPSAHTTAAQNVVTGMQKSRLTIDHLKPNVEKPVRDSGDELGLVKSRLFLDAMTQQGLHSAIDIYERSLAFGDSQETARAELQKNIRKLRDETWGGNTVKKLTDQGFANLQQVEASYDAIRKMTNAFSKPHHGLNLTSRTLFNAPNQAQLIENVEKELKSLSNGESLTFNSGYGAFASSMVLPGSQTLNVTGARVNADRGYSLAFTRGEDGLTVTVGRNGSGGIAPFTALGYNVLTGHVDPNDVSFGKNDSHTASPVVRLGVAASANLQRQAQNSVTFSLGENELNSFLSRLASDQIDPLELLDRGNDHKVKNGSTWTASLDTNGAAQASIGVPMTNKNEKEHIAMTRVGGGVSVGANIAAASRERNNNGNASSNKHTRSDNRARFFNQGSADARFMSPTGVTNRTDQARQPISAITGAGVRFSFDNRTKQALSLELAQPQRLAGTHIDKLTESLSKAFTDRATAQLMASLKDPDAKSDKTAKTPDEKLDALLTFFGQHEAQGKVTNNAQYGAIRELVKLRQQREALTQRVPLPGSAEYQSTYNNLAKINGNGLLHWIGDLFSHETESNHELSNANRIRAMMANDTHLSGLLQQMQLSSDTQAVVTLEPKDEMKERLNADWLAGRISRDELEKRLQTRSDMRIKSIAFTESKSKSDGVATPMFLLGGGSSVSIAKSRNLGKISFSYGRDQQSPLSYTLEGELAKRSTEQLAVPLGVAQQNGRVLKS